MKYDNSREHDVSLQALWTRVVEADLGTPGAMSEVQTAELGYGV
jgi:hypothetical protein